MTIRSRRVGPGRRLAPGLVSIVALVTALAPAARAGPPFVTDDPEPTDLGHWEIYDFVSATHSPGVTTGQAGLDLNYGAARDLQLTATIPADFQTGQAAAQGDLELGAKYRILHQRTGGLAPDLAVFPHLILPTGPARFGDERPSLFLPIWGQKDFGPWSLFSGGGYEIHPGPDNRDFWLVSAALTRSLGRGLTLGVEAYHQTPDAPDSRPFTGLNLGAIVKLTDHWSFLAAAGPGVENTRQGGQYDVYLALETAY